MKIHKCRAVEPPLPVSTLNPFNKTNNKQKDKQGGIFLMHDLKMHLIIQLKIIKISQTKIDHYYSMHYYYVLHIYYYTVFFISTVTFGTLSRLRIVLLQKSNFQCSISTQWYC